MQHINNCKQHHHLFYTNLPASLVYIKYGEVKIKDIVMLLQLVLICFTKIRFHSAYVGILCLLDRFHENDVGARQMFRLCWGFLA